MRLFKQATVACGPCELGAESLDNMGEGSQLLARSLEMPLSLQAAVQNPTKNIGLRQFLITEKVRQNKILGKML